MAKEAAKLGQIDFGSDAWGAWAASVQDRLAALEADTAVSDVASVLDKGLAEVNARLDAIESVVAAKGAKAIKAEAHDIGDVNGRLSALERAAGIHPALETEDDSGA